MRNLGRSLLAYSLVATLVVPNAYALPAPAGAHMPSVPVSPVSIDAANNSYLSPEGRLLSLTPNIAPEKRARFLNDKRIKMIKTGGNVANEILNLQAMLVLIAAVSFRASEEHRETLALSNGQIPEANSVAGNCTGGGALSVTACSGEFWTGMIGGAAFLGANSAAGALIKSFMKETSKRMALFQVITAMGSTSAMMFGATASSFVWTEAVKALPSAEMIQKADGVAGRALKAAIRMDFTAFQQSEDGQIFNAIVQNIVNITWSDSAMRSQWIYNTVRFGLLRGEFITAMGVLMGASAASTLILAAAGVTIAGAGVVLTAALGFGAMYLVLGTDATGKITRLIQNARSFKASITMRRARNEIKVISYSAFAMGRNSDNENYIRVFDQGYLKDRIDWLQSAREAYANVAIEQFYELLLAQTDLSRNIEIAETAVRSQALQKNLFVEVDGQAMSFEEAKKKLCQSNGQCDHSIAKQIETLESLRPLLAQSRQALTAIVQDLLNQYTSDAQMIEAMWAGDAPVLFPVPTAERMGEVQVRSDAVGKSLATTMAKCDPVVAQNFGIKTTSDENMRAQTQMAGLYTQSFVEANYFAELVKSSPLAVNR